MSAPVCPPDYTCQFTLIHPHTIVRSTDPWWQLSAGWVVALIAVIVAGAVVAYASYLAHEARRDIRARSERERQRQHDLNLAEQRTMQVEQAKGNPEMLKIIERWR